MQQDKSDRIALVTGGSRGIGSAIAQALAKDNFHVVLHYHQSHAAAKATLDKIQANNGRASLVQADLLDPKQSETLIQQVESEIGPLHTLVCNAGIITTKPLTFTAYSEWREVMGVNLDALFLLTKSVSKGLALRRKGRIIYISSNAGLMGDLMRAAYSSSKAGIGGLAKTAARELAKSGVTVNLVSPGIIESDMTADMPASRRTRQMESIPMGRFGQPEEVAAVVRFLASDNAAWITGQTLIVDGGMNMQ